MSESIKQIYSENEEVREKTNPKTPKAAMTPPRPILVVASIPNAGYNFSYRKTVMPDPTRSKRFNLRLRAKIAPNDRVQRIVDTIVERMQRATRYAAI
ncbi:unnamed protein product [Toxocara canis]|uniref:DUF3467 domain-containing protein n=1 Tax=Toxocara canis TaxID=6265 RepID=A0A183VAD5_TOXCA|nr:unnamed protein product [Toxocara canis]